MWFKLQDFLQALYEKSPWLFSSVLLGVGVFLLGVFVQKLLRHFLQRWKKEEDQPHWPNLLLRLTEALNLWFFLALGVHVGLQSLPLEERWLQLEHALWMVIALFYLVKISFILVQFWARKIVKRKQTEDPADQGSLIYLLANISKGFIVILAFLFFISNLGYDITTLLAGLGVGGIAVAFALQSILEDIFASFSIYFDKPFEEGDFIIVGGDMGVVKKIGIKTTRVQTLEGQELVISNTELTQSRINNYKKMNTRRIEFGFRIDYATPLKKIKKLPEQIQKIIESQEKTCFDRAHLARLGESALEFVVVYFIEDQDYNLYMNIQQSINWELMAVLEKEKIEVAFPARALHFKTPLASQS